MSNETILGAVTVVMTAGLLAGLVTVALRRRVPHHGVPVRVDCPEDHQPAEVRIGKNDTGELSVLWCDRFPDRPIGCRQACFIQMNEEARTA